MLKSVIEACRVVGIDREAVVFSYKMFVEDECAGDVAMVMVIVTVTCAKDGA